MDVMCVWVQPQVLTIITSDSTSTTNITEILQNESEVFQCLT